MVGPGVSHQALAEAFPAYPLSLDVPLDMQPHVPLTEVPVPPLWRCLSTQGARDFFGLGSLAVSAESRGILGASQRASHGVSHGVSWRARRGRSCSRWEPWREPESEHWSDASSGAGE